jgi:hypothetical protein
MEHMDETFSLSLYVVARPAVDTSLLLFRECARTCPCKRCVCVLCMQGGSGVRRRALPARPCCRPHKTMYASIRFIYQHADAMRDATRLLGCGLCSGLVSSCSVVCALHVLQHRWL